MAATLVRGGFLVIRTGNADAFDYTVTQVIAQGSPAEDDAREARRAAAVVRECLQLEVPIPLPRAEPERAGPGSRLARARGRPLWDDRRLRHGQDAQQRRERLAQAELQGMGIQGPDPGDPLGDPADVRSPRWVGRRPEMAPVQGQVVVDVYHTDRCPIHWRNTAPKMNRPMAPM